MKVLVVCRYHNRISPFVEDQVNSIQKMSVLSKYFLLKSGVWGYVKAYPQYLKKIKQFQPDIIHAHFGLSGLCACFYRKIPVITTFRGSDINFQRNRILSRITIWLSTNIIFVSKSLAIKVNKNSSIKLLELIFNT